MEFKIYVGLFLIAISLVLAGCVASAPPQSSPTPTTSPSATPTMQPGASAPPGKMWVKIYTPQCEMQPYVAQKIAAMLFPDGEAQDKYVMENILAIAKEYYGQFGIAVYDAKLVNDGGSGAVCSACGCPSQSHDELLISAADKDRVGPDGNVKNQEPAGKIWVKIHTPQCEMQPYVAQKIAAMLFPDGEAQDKYVRENILAIAKEYYGQFGIAVYDAKQVDDGNSGAAVCAACGCPSKSHDELLISAADKDRVGPDGNVKNQEPAGKRLSGDELAANPEKYAGNEITAYGIVEKGNEMCTLMACSEQNPCCNHCSAALGFGRNAALPFAINDTSGYFCSGNECSIDCKPFIIGGYYRVTGTISKDSENGKYGFIVRSFEKAGLV